jgi:hypothetical protein
VGNAGLI